MELSKKEFRAMNHPVRRFLQRTLEFPLFKKFGLADAHKRILEIGCGSGYGAMLLSNLKPSLYYGIDIMPEQIELARKRNLAGCCFRVADASRLSFLANESFDYIVIFGILHHMPEWKETIKEGSRVLVRGGMLFLEEPDKRFIAAWDSVFKWGHTSPGFLLKELEGEMTGNGFQIMKKIRFAVMGAYSAVKC